MIALRMYPDKTLWSAPNLTWDEAMATAIAWSEENIECIIVNMPDNAINFELDEDEEA
jgi:hypothetical protein